MSKLYRSLLWSGLVVAGVAACGDDVTVSPPPPPVLTVRSVSVGPTGVTISVGQTLQMAAAVNADAGVATTVTWSSSSPAVATVNPTSGLVTAVANGSVAITACSTVVTSVCGQATVTVSAGTVNSVTVGPTGVVIQIGQTQQMAAAVNAGPGVPTTVTWSSSNPAIASVVPATGLVTAVASGSVAITACSTVVPSVCGQATLTVGAVTPAVISIKSITTGVTNVPVNLNNVAGQIDVTLNLDAGTQTVSSVDVLIDGVVAGSQSFSALRMAEIRAKAQAALLAAGDATAALVVEIVISINTAEFNATTGVAKFLNGPRLVSARVNLVGSAPVATPSTTLTFNNQSGIIVVVVSSNAPSPNTAINPATGLQWLGGSVTFNVIGVSYEAGAVTVASANFTLFGKTVAVPLTAGLGTVTFSEGTVWTAGNTGVGNYLSPAAGETATFATAVLSNGQNILVPVGGNVILNFGAVPGGNASVPVLQILRLDNTSPGVTSANGIVQTPITIAAMAAVWVNFTTAFSPSNAALGVPALSALNAQTVGVDTEEGVDAITVTFFATAFGAALPTSACSTTGMTAVLTGADLAATTVSAAYRIRVVFTDGLGNQTCLSLAPGAVVGGQLGADFIAPTGTVTGPAAGPPGLNVDPGTFTVAATDNASGFLAVAVPGGGPLQVIMTRLNVTGTTTCVIGSGTGCVTPADLALVPSFDATGGPNTEGYYTTSITLVDQAGNTTVLVTARLYSFDITVPGFAGGISLPALIAGAATNTFTATATDNLDLNAIFGDVTYSVTGTVLRYPSQTIGTWGPPLEQSVAVPYAVANWVRCINAAGSFAVASGPPTGITLTASDQATNIFALASAAFGANAEVCAGAVGNIPLPGVINSFIQNAPVYGTGLTQVDIDGLGLAAVSSTTVTLAAVADVTLNSSVDPFSRVDFYYVSGGVHIKIGTATVVLAQTLTNRTYTYTVVWDPDATIIPGGVVVALGVDAQGDAVLTATQAVTIVP